MAQNFIFTTIKDDDYFVSPINDSLLNYCLSIETAKRYRKKFLTNSEFDTEDRVIFEIKLSDLEDILLNMGYNRKNIEKVLFDFFNQAIKETKENIKFQLSSNENLDILKELKKLKFDVWVSSLKILINSKVTKSDFFYICDDYSFNDYFFNETPPDFKSKTKDEQLCINFLLKSYDFLFLNEDSDNFNSTYETPFWNNYQFLYFFCLCFKDEPNFKISIDITSIAKNSSENYKKSTSIFTCLFQEFTNNQKIIFEKFSSTDDELYKSLLFSYSISNFEHFLRSFFKTLALFNPIMKEKIVEKDSEFQKSGKINISDIFKTYKNINNNIIKTLNEKSFQNLNAIKLYAFDILGIDQNSCKFDKNMYSDFLNIRNQIVHKCGGVYSGNHISIPQEKLKIHLENMEILAKDITFSLFSKK